MTHYTRCMVHAGRFAASHGECICLRGLSFRYPRFIKRNTEVSTSDWAAQRKAICRMHVSEGICEAARRIRSGHMEGRKTCRREKLT